MVSIKSAFLSFYRALSGKGLSKLFPKRFLLWIQKKLTKEFKDEDKVIMLEIDKIKYNFYPRANDELLLWGVYERGVTKVVKEISRNFDVFVDVGACFGYFTLLSEAQRNIAIEPNPENFRILTLNMDINNLEAELIKKAIAEEEGIQILYSSGKRKCHSLMEEHILDKITDQIEVETTSLDILFPNYQNKSFLLKIDVEGHEPYVFKGMTNLLKNDNIAIIFEYSPHKNSEKEKQIIFDIAKQFLLYMIDDEKEILEIINQEILESLETRKNILMCKKTYEQLSN